MEWKMEWNGTEISVWNVREWNGMEDFKNGVGDNLPYFYTNSILILLMAFTEEYIQSDN